jgi:transcriptional regulator GlxA family with amidase domain
MYADGRACGLHQADQSCHLNDMRVTSSGSTHHVGFLLVPNFALMSFAAASEPLRAANLLAGSDLYRIGCFSMDGAPVRSSSGLEVPCGRLDRADLHTLFVCAGGVPDDWRQPGLPAALRALARDNVRLGGISGGPFLLAEAGLLAGRDFTIHWEHAATLMEAFPDLNPRQARFVLDGDRITCGGGVAPLDMMHALISERMGSDFARRVSDWYLHTTVSESGDPQRAAAAERYGTHHAGLLAALEAMESAIENPLPSAAIARSAGVGPRQLARLFRSELGCTCGDAYLTVRLRHAARLLRQSPLSLAQVAYATGFSSPSHLCRAFRSRYRTTPGAWRRNDAFSREREAQAGVTRQMTSPTSSATRSERSGPTVTPTGRP